MKYILLYWKLIESIYNRRNVCTMALFRTTDLRDKIHAISQLLYSGNWLQLKNMVSPEHNLTGYEFICEPSRSGNTVVVIPFRRISTTTNGIIPNALNSSHDNTLQYLCRVEGVPCWGITNPMICSLTGGVDKGDTITDTVIKELREESGYDINKNKLIDLGSVFGIKSSDGIFHLYTCDLTDIEKAQRAEPETAYEKAAYCEWFTEEEIQKKSGDPFVLCTISKIKYTLK